MYVECVSDACPEERDGNDGRTDEDLEALERALIEGRVGATPDQAGLEAWLAREGIAPGRAPSVPTVEAFVLYRRFAESVGAVPLAPYDFARTMLGRLNKRPASVKRDGGFRWVPCYLVNGRAARRLRAQSADHPATADDRAFFTFRALREARFPSRKET